MKIVEFPNPLKLGIVTPIFKKDNEELMKNYRPISTLPTFGKNFETIIYIIYVRLYIISLSPKAFYTINNLQF